MIYEIIGKIVITSLIMICIPVVMIITYVILDLLFELLGKLPQWIRTIISIVFLGSILILLGVSIYSGL